MFTGLVEEIGRVRSKSRQGDYQHLTIDAQDVLDDLHRGDSISVNGVCQTVIDIDEKGFAVETLAVSLQKTNLGELKKNVKVTLERALKVNSRLAGHMVQGHVDGLGRVSALRRNKQNTYLELVLPDELMKFCVPEGSIAVDGISLTIAWVRGARIVLNIIPTTWEHTLLKDRRIGDRLNIEVDMMARYAAKILENRDYRRTRIV